MNHAVKPKFDPYSSFKNDRDRFWALVSRDVRLVLIAVTAAFGTSQAAPAVSSWVMQVVRLTN